MCALLVDFLVLTAIFSAWIFLFKKIHVGDNLECKRAARNEAGSHLSTDTRIYRDP